MEVAAELAAHRLTVRRLLDRHGIRGVRPIPAERAAPLAELGFLDLAAYLKARHVGLGGH